LLHHWAAGRFECVLLGTVSAKFFHGACVASDSWKVADRFSWESLWFNSSSDLI
jgi:hypothetical protein